MTEPNHNNQNQRPRRPKLFDAHRDEHKINRRVKQNREPSTGSQIDRKPIVDRRYDVAGDHVNLRRSTGTFRELLDGSMTKITDIYRQDTVVNAESQRKAGRRVFRLKGYTTVGKINRKFKQERQQRVLRNILTTMMVILLLIILFFIYNPFKDTSELRKISGEDSLYKNQTTTSVSSEEKTDGNVTP